jgi:DNA-binding GntR family transcriptional regulator
LSLLNSTTFGEDLLGQSAELGDRPLQTDRSLQHDVYAVIVDWIHQGKLKPGERVSEAAIARHLGISRGPVREAISRLDHEGLVSRRPRRGALVSEFSAKDLEEIASVRQLIEGHAARLACQLVTSQDLKELDGLVSSMKAAAETGHWTETAVLNGRFHQLVVRIADNKILSKMWQTLHPLAWLLAPVASANQPHNPESMVIRHRLLLEALQAGDPDRAEEAFRQHVVQSTRSTIDQWTASKTDVPPGPLPPVAGREPDVDHDRHQSLTSR